MKEAFKTKSLKVIFFRTKISNNLSAVCDMYKGKAK